ncbi:uncharacterized protein LOC110753277 [Prunus avium]|uniref:Uncharacterized protein LOC110753277 n=1 Tax=Prunus avium TaxID=42229 RepID=A0A6P5S7S2_PRUAV|nr:uncharacterized protein LOC110753277 [Prunus avium]
MARSRKTKRERPETSSSSQNDKQLILKCKPTKHIDAAVWLNTREKQQNKGNNHFSLEMMNSNSTTRKRGRGLNKRFWTTKEDSALVESLQELYHDTSWRDDNGFKNGYLGHIEAMLEFKLPGCGIHASPHIESRVKTLKKKYSALCEMLAQNGFGWDDEQMMLVCDRRVYDEWVKKRKEASGLYGRSFPFYYIFGEIYGKGRPIGANVGNADDEEEEIRREDANIDQTLGGDNDFDENVNLNVDKNMESESEGMEEFDVSFSSQQRRPAQSSPSVSGHGRRVKAKVMEEVRKGFGSMAASIEAMSSKIDVLIKILSPDKKVGELQAKLDGELSKIEGLTGLQVFRATNILATNHDLLRVFFTMSEERKKIYVTNLLEYGL